MTTESSKPVELDVRPIIEKGEEPFELIMTTAAEVPDGGTLRLLVPFEPAPLYGVMGGKGFVSRSVEDEDGTWVVRFTRMEVSGDSTVKDVNDRYPATTDVFAEHGMDMCCGGHLSLETAAKGHDVALDALIDELIEAVMGGK